MLIDQEEFDLRLNEQRLQVAWVGMSNSGKSTCTRLLTGQAGFGSFEVDQAINGSLGFETMEQAAGWMGHPFETGYQANKKTYLELEEQHTRMEIPTGENFVLDTTGSIIYGSEGLQRWIAEHFLVVGLRVSESLCRVLIDDYFEKPKTVIWGNEFSQEPGETGLRALKRCFPALLAQRGRMYSRLADLEIEAQKARDAQLTATQLLAAIREKLPSRP